MMTPQQLRDLADAIESDQLGETTQFKDHPDCPWADSYGLRASTMWDFTVLRRPKPKPVLRAWSKPSDVPGPGPCYLRLKGVTAWAMITGADNGGLNVVLRGYLKWIELEGCEYSMTRAADDWHECRTEAPLEGCEYSTTRADNDWHECKTEAP